MDDRDLREKMKNARLEYVHNSLFKTEENKSLSEYKFDVGEIKILDTPVRRLLEDALYTDVSVVDAFRTIYYRYKELVLDIIDELDLKS